MALSCISLQRIKELEGMICTRVISIYESKSLKAHIVLVYTSITNHGA